MNDRKKSDKELQKENEEMKSRISKEFGGVHGRGDNVPPELENQFLKYILEFEEQFAKGKETTVYDRIGRPEWIPETKLSDAEVEKKLQWIYERLHMNNLAIDSICGVEDRVMYRFITEELFDHVILDMSVPGMMTNFIYEEFHPNHEYDVEQAVLEFITHTLLQNSDTDDWLFNSDLKVWLNPDIDLEKAIRNIKNFINSWSDFSIHQLEITALKLSEDEQRAQVVFDIAYNATLDDSREVVSFEGEGRMSLVNVFERYGVAGWDVKQCDMPGFKL